MEGPTEFVWMCVCVGREKGAADEVIPKREQGQYVTTGNAWW